MHRHSYRSISSSLQYLDDSRVDLPHGRETRHYKSNICNSLRVLQSGSDGPASPFTQGIFIPPVSD